jgi:hypothetical protein
MEKFCEILSNANVDDKEKFIISLMENKDFKKIVFQVLEEKHLKETIEIFKDYIIKKIKKDFENNIENW